MLTESSFARLYKRVTAGRSHMPVSGHLDLTYRCGFNCVHCYCKGLGESERELSTAEWKRIISDAHAEGCLSLVVSGGEPCLRDDFLDIYSFLRTKGFLVTLFTSGYGIRTEILSYLVRYPPAVIEMTLNGITPRTFEAVTRTGAALPQVLATIRFFVKHGLPLRIKTNVLRQNIHEVSKIKSFVDQTLGKPDAGGHYFQYDPFIFPRLDGNTRVCSSRLPFRKIYSVLRGDKEIWDEHCLRVANPASTLNRDQKYLYQCSDWKRRFYVSPFGWLKFCLLTERFGVDLRAVPFKSGFYNVFPLLMQRRYRNSAQCRHCGLKPFCGICPAHAALEAQDEEAPVAYYCEVAKAVAEAYRKAHVGSDKMRRRSR